MENIIPHQGEITQKNREQLMQQKAVVYWFEGLSGSGKSTLSAELEIKLFQKGLFCYRLDGDNLRNRLNADLSFSVFDRRENIRRAGEIAKLFIEAGIIVIASFISPLQEDREQVKKLFSKNEFIEIFVDCPLKECEKRDVKGLYQKVRNGEIENFTGISSPFEIPKQPDIILRTDLLSINESVDRILQFSRKGRK